MSITTYADLILAGYTDDDIQGLLNYTDDQYKELLRNFGMFEDEEDIDEFDYFWYI